jgi:hypothetical protein
VPDYDSQRGENRLVKMDRGATSIIHRGRKKNTSTLNQTINPVRPMMIVPRLPPNIPPFHRS